MGFSQDFEYGISHGRACGIREDGERFLVEEKQKKRKEKQKNRIYTISTLITLGFENS